MAASAISRRAALATLAGVLAGPAFADAAAPWTFRAVEVDVSRLRRAGDTITADGLARELPSLLNESLGARLTPGDRRAPVLVARVDAVTYGPNTSGGHHGGSDAIDFIEGAGVVVGGSGREVASYPLLSTSIAHPDPFDVTGEAARLRVANLARSFAYYLPGKIGG
jgi:hypothetical protein